MMSLRFALLLIVLVTTARGVSAETTWPAKPVKLVVPSSAGGGTDAVARVLAEQLSRTLGQQFYIENRAGAGNMIGIEAVAKSPPDGYTILVTASPLTINHLTYKNVAYDAERDFAPVSLLVTLPNILVVHPKVPAKTLAELIALAKAKPGVLNYGSAGVGTNPHFAMELLKSMAGIDMRHVPFRGAGPVINETMAGTVEVSIANMLTGKPQAEAGTLRGLAVTSRKRVDGLPDVPTMAEAGFPAYEASQWYGMLAPAGTPSEIIARLHAEVVNALAAPEVRQRLALDAADPVGNTPAEFAAFIRDEIKRWTAVAKTAGITP